jgi:hypothetical protein
MQGSVGVAVGKGVGVAVGDEGVGGWEEVDVGLAAGAPVGVWPATAVGVAG